MNRPGVRLRALAASWCDGRTMALVVDPLIADLQREHAEARRRGHVWRSRWLRFGGTVDFWKVMVAMDSTPNERGLLLRTAGYSVAAIAAVTMLFAMPIFFNTSSLSPVQYFVYAIPQLFSIAIPVGIAIGIVGVLAGVAPSGRVKAGVLVLAVAGATASFATTGWISPAAGHAERVASGRAGRDLSDLDARSPAELTLGQLSERIHKAADFGLSADLGYLRFLLQIYYGRWAFPAASLALTLCLLAALGIPGAGRTTLGGVAFALVVGYEAIGVFAAHMNQQSAIPVALAAWLPNIVLALIAATLMLVSRRPQPPAAEPPISA